MAGGKRLVDWAETRLGQKWTLCQSEHIEGRVIRAREVSFSPDGLKVVIGDIPPWFSLQLGERMVDAERFHRLRLRARASEAGSIAMIVRGPGGTARADAAISVGTQWRRADVDLRRLRWRSDAAGRRAASWEGIDGVRHQVCFRLDFPVQCRASVEIANVELLGTGPADNDPPRIVPLAAEGGAVRFRIADRAGIRASSLLLAAEGVVYDLSFSTLSWDGEALTWRPKHLREDNPTVYVQAEDREGNRACAEFVVGNPHGERPALRAGFLPQQREREIEVTSGTKKSYTIATDAAHPPVNCRIEISGAVENPKVAVRGGIDFDTPASVARSILKPGMTDREKAYAIWRFEMDTAYSLGMANPIDRTTFMNCFGYGYCTAHAQTVQALCEEADLDWMFVQYQYPDGHGSQQMRWDGAWHVLDSHQRRYLLTDAGRKIASASEIEGDPDCICPGSEEIGHWREIHRYPKVSFRPVDRNPIHGTAIYKSILPGSMAMRLRAGERLVRTWQGHGRWAHSPCEPLDYANGFLVFDACLTRAGVGAEAEEQANLAFDRDGGVSPRYTSAPGRIVYRMHAPYLMVGGRVQLAGRTGSRRDRIRVAVSTDEGATWRKAWSSRSAGFCSREIDLSGFMSKQSVESDSPEFRDVFSFLLKIELVVGEARSAVWLEALRVAADLQLAPVALPALRAGTNRLRFTCAKRSGPVKIRHLWEEPVGLTASAPEPVASESVTFRAEVVNREDDAVGPVDVRFYEGHPDAGGRPIGDPVRIERIAPGATAAAQIEWTAHTEPNRPLLPPHKGYLHTDVYAVAALPGRARPAEGLDGIARVRVRVRDVPKMEFHEAFVGCEPRRPAPGEEARLYAEVFNRSSARRPYGRGFIYVHGSALENVRVRFHAGDPRKGGKVIGQQVLPRIEPLEHGLAEVTWRVPARGGATDVYVTAEHASGPPSAHQSITARLRVRPRR